MALLTTPNSCDLAFDAVPDKPREIIDNGKCDSESRARNDDNVVKEEEIIKPRPVREETTINSNPQPAVEISSRNERDPSKVKEGIAQDKQKTKTRKKTTHKNSTPQQGTTVFNISKSTGVHIGNNLVIQCDGLNSLPKSGLKTPKKSKEVKKILQSTEVITLDHIDAVSSHIGVNWMEVGRQLKYTDGQLEQFYEDHGRKGLKEVVYQLLLDWKRVNTTNARVGVLCNALWTASQYDAVDAIPRKS